MTIKEIFSRQTSNDVISELKSRRFIPQPDVESAKKALDPELHKVNDPRLRPDKRVRADADNDADSAQKVIDTGEATSYKIEKVARIRLALQKLIIKRAVSFCFGNPVLYNATPGNDSQSMIINALNRILYDNKTNSLNRKAGRAIFGFKECAELWYPVEKPNTSYGFDSRFKLRCAVFSPETGDTLYPYWDETGDMIAFSRSFSQKDSEENAVEYFETYTDTEYWLWMNGANGYEVVEGYPKPVSIGKIPVIYGRQEQFETEDVDSLIDRLETLLSNFADTNDYHASPKIFVTGNIIGWSKKGEAGAVVEGEDGATMQYVSWQNAPESVKLEIETLLKMIYTITQTPDISFESVRGIGTVSGIALKLLFMDAHLKVQDKREIFDDYLQRRVNVIKAYIGKFNTALEKECEAFEIEPEITPYMLTSEIDEVNMWLAANGNKPLVSQKQSVKSASLSQDPEADFEQIREEASRENSFVIGEPVLDA
jgi:SPP1 family phage portal protein